MRTSYCLSSNNLTKFDSINSNPPVTNAFNILNDLIDFTEI